MDSYAIRNYRAADKDRYVRFHSGAEPICRFEDTFLLASLKGESPNPIKFSEEDFFLAEEREIIVGACRVVSEPAIDRAALMLLVKPGSLNTGAAAGLLRAALKRAADLGAARVHADLLEKNTAACDLFAGLGFSPVRRSIEMALKLDPASIAEPEREGLSHRPLIPGGEAKFTELQNRAFAGTWGFCPNTSAEIIEQLNAPGYGHAGVIITYHGEEAVGYCWTADVNPSAQKDDAIIGRIHMMGIAPKFRGRGFGKYILSSGLKHLADKGIQTVELTTGAEKESARTLYERAGFKPTTTFVWYEKKLR